MQTLDRAVPPPIMRGLLWIGSGVALLCMSEQRRFSKRFLTEALGRRATWRDSWKHFNAFTAFLMERFRVARGRQPKFLASEESDDRIEALAKDGRQALYGTFHFGQSDIMGFWLSKFDLSIRMVRQQVGNSADLEWLDKRFGKKVGFLWVNEPADMLFALKAAVDEGHSIAMKCDRVQHSSKLEVFEFLGKRRWFPFTIYHLAFLFDLPIVFAFGVLNRDHDIEVHSSKCFWPDPSDKRATLAMGREHFAETLRLLEDLVRTYPYQWFNFLDATPLAEEKAATAEAVTR